MPCSEHQVPLMPDLLIPFTECGSILIRFGCRKAAANAQAAMNLRVILNKAAYSPKKSMYRLQIHQYSLLYNRDT